MSEKKIEFLDIYDKDKNKTGKIIERETAVTLNEDEFVNSVQCWIINADNKILLTKRRINKKNGGTWEPTVGLVQSGETSLQGIKRELQEEIGLFLDDNELKLISTKLDKSEKYNFIRDTYIVKKDIDLKNISFNDGEVIDVKYVTIDEFEEMINNHEILDYLKYFIDIFYSVI